MPNLAALSQSSPRHLPQTHAAQQPSHPQGVPGPGERSREAQEAKEREAREVHIKEEQDAAVRRERDGRDRQHTEQLPPHQTQSAPIHLHQPVAVGPRTIHGPNGLLGNPAAIAGPTAHPQMGGPPGPANIFAGGPVQPAGQPGQPMQPGLLVPFGAQAQAAAVGQGQQPILNVCFSALQKSGFPPHQDAD